LGFISRHWALLLWISDFGFTNDLSDSGHLGTSIVDLGFRISDFGFWVLGLGIYFPALGASIVDFGFRIYE
jgi:hypothetical protein